MRDPVTASLWLLCYLLPLSEVMLISGFGEMHEAPGGGGVTAQRAVVTFTVIDVMVFSLYQDRISHCRWI